MNVVLVKVRNVGAALQEPKQLMDDAFHKHLLGRQKGESFAQVEAHLMTKHRPRSSTRTVALLYPLVSYPAHERKILLHF
jgi:hypothetical protein